MVWVDRSGQEEPTAVPLGDYGSHILSPDGRSVAVQVADEAGNSDIWVYDLDSGTPTRLTFDPADDDDPVWTPDGKYVLFFSSREDRGLYRKSADGAGGVELLADLDQIGELMPYSLSPDGQQLVLVSWPDPNNLWLLTLGDDQPVPFLQSETDARSAAISPDGQWIAYEAELPASDQIIVQPFPELDGGIWQVTTAGGSRPFWGPDGQQLFYTDNDGSIGFVNLELDPSEVSVRVVSQSTVILENASSYFPDRSISPDGSRFLVQKRTRVGGGERAASRVSLTVVENWFEELKLLAPIAEPSE
jgi:Tol biopolymer transport system component